MAYLISLIVFNIQCLIIAGAFFYSLKMYYKCYHRYMKSFILFTTIAILVMIPMALSTNKIYNISFAYKLNNLSILFNYTYLVYFILKSMGDRKGNNIFILAYVVSLIAIILLLVINNLRFPIQSAFALNHFGLIFFSIIFLLKLFQNIPEQLITSIPSFWVVMGVLICSCLSFPFISILDFINKTGINYKNNILLLNLPNIGYSIMYLFFIKAFKCSTKKQVI